MLRVFSFGGGVQSTAALVLAAQHRIDYHTFLFSNVGIDSENPDTLAYIEQVSKPFAARHGLTLIELSRPGETLRGRILGEANRGYVIPAYTPDKQRARNGSPGRRICTQDFKVEVIASWCREHNASASSPASIGMGISYDEAPYRMNVSRIAWEVLDYPLVDLKIDRQQCLNIIAAAGLPTPPARPVPFAHIINCVTGKRCANSTLNASNVRQTLNGLLVSVSNSVGVQWSILPAWYNRLRN